MKKFKVQWTRSASLDLFNIIEYLSQDFPQRAQKISRRLKKSTQKLKSFPRQGRIVPGLRAYGILVYRELIESPWRIIYKTSESKVDVFAVIDGRRDVEDFLFQRLLYYS